jgi:hypothetical protein
MIPDHTGHFAFWGGDYLGVYDTTSHDWTNINAGQFASSDISGIDLSPNGDFWISSYHKLGIYSGGNWNIIPTNSYGTIRVVNDTSAYFGNYDLFRYHNGVFDTLPQLPAGAIPRDMDVAPNGDLWVAAETKLVHYSGNNSQSFDSANTPLGTDKFLRVVIGNNGHVWTSGSASKLYEYDGANWTTHQLPYYYPVENFTLDSIDHPWVISADIYQGQCRHSSLYIWNGNTFNPGINFTFNPYLEIKSIANNAVANDDGIFIFNFNFYYYFSFNQFVGGWDYPKTSDLNCLRVHDPTGSTSINDIMFGTDYGVLNPGYYYPGLDTSVLPNDTINYIDNYNGSDYICTNQGLLIYNGVIYNTFDTSNSPLPSNKITYISVAPTSPATLWIGTDQGFAEYYNGQWTVYDSATIGSNNFYVTGILSYDTTIYVSTLGNGLIEFYSSGGHLIRNTSNGNFADDSLYYVVRVEIPSCFPGYEILTGTNSHGIAEIDPLASTIVYSNTTTGFPFDQSKAGVDLFSTSGYYLIATNSGLYYSSDCVGIINTKPTAFINIFPNPASGSFTIANCADTDLEIFDMYGASVLSIHSFESETKIDLSDKSSGVYLIRCKGADQTVTIHKLIKQ